MMVRTRVPHLAAAIASLLGFTACEGPVEPDVVEPLIGEPRLSRLAAEAGAAAVALPFEARFFTSGQGLQTDPACGAPPRLLNTQVGEGEATHLGRVTVRITFCMDVTDVLDDGMLTEGESLPYDSGLGTLVAANGDELHIEISGSVVPSDDPAFDFEFHDPFSVTGGTGRFAGAAGEGTSDSFVVQALDRTTHGWSGTLVLPRGR